MADIRFALLGSGSRGNALVVAYRDTTLLIDAGFSSRVLESRLARLALAPGDLDAIVITHEHDDHWRGASRLSQRYRLPVWLTPGTRAATAADPIHRSELYSPHEAFAIGDLELFPYPVPHDAREPAQLVVGDGDKRLAILSDSGYATPHIQSVVDGCDGLIVEANHDSDLLASGAYPAVLKQRIGSDRGHLSNDQAAALIAGLDTAALQQIVIAHLSESNNEPALARATLAAALGCAPDWIAVADQRDGLPWRSLVSR